MNKTYLYIVLVIFTSVYSIKASACSPYGTPTLDSQGMSGGNLDLVWTSTTAWTCDYWIKMEIICNNQPFTGNPNYTSGCITKPSTADMNYPSWSIPLSDFCPGVTYKFRAKECACNSNTSCSGWSTTSTFTAPSSISPISLSINASTTTICTPDCATLTADHTGGCGPFTYSWAPDGQTSQSISVCPTASTTYTVTVQDICAGQSATESVTIDVLPSPVAGTASLTSGGSGADPSELCEGQTATVALTGYDGTIQWQSSTDGGGSWTAISGATSDTYTSDPLFVDHCFRAEVSGCGGSVFSNDVCVTILPPPTATVNNETICDGDTTTLAATPSPGGGTYLWSTSETTQSIDVFPSATTTYTVTYTSIEGCPGAPADGTVTVNPIPVVTLNDDEVCITAGDCAVLTADPSITGGTYLWDTGETTQSISPCPTTATPYSVTYTVNNCVSEPATGTVYITTIHDATITPAGPFCPYDDEVTLTAASSGGTWMGTGITDAANGVFDPVVAGTGTHTISYVIADPCGDSASTDIVVAPLPVPSFTNDDACELGVMTFTNTSTIISGSITGNDWDFGDATTSTQTNPAHIYGANGPYNVLLIATSDQGCVDSIMQTVSVDDVPDADFIASTVCIGNTTQFNDLSTVSGASIVSWDWYFDDSNTSTLQNPDNTYASSGTYNVQLTVTADGPAACANTVTLPVTVHADPVADFNPSEACLNTPTQFFDQSTPSGTITNWEWDFNNDAVIDNTNENPTYTFPSTGTFSVYLFVEASTGCTADTTLPVTVNPLPQAQFTSDSVCANFPTSLSGQPAGGGTINQWDWDVNNNGTYEYSAQNANHTWTTGGTYDVKLRVTTTDGCVDSIVNQVIVHPEPVADFIADPECLNDATSFASTSTVASGVISGYNWDFGTSTSSVANPVHTFSTAGQHMVTLTVTSNNGCTDMIQKNVEIYDLPVAQFTVDPVCEKDEMAVFNNISIPTTANTDYSWDFGDSNSSGDEFPQHVYNNGGTYNVQLIATSVPDGCKDTATFNLDVYDKPLAQFSVSDECVYDSVSFNNTSNSYSSTFSSFEWDFDDFNSSADQDPTHMYNIEDIYEVELIVTTADDCKDTAWNKVNVYPEPQADFSPTQVCLNTATTFSDKSTVSTMVFPNAQILANQQWIFGDGWTGPGPSPTHTYTSPGEYLATIMVTTNHGCRDTVDKTVLVHPNPAADFSVIDNTGCSPVFAQFSDSSSIISNPGNYILSHTWHFGNGDTAQARNSSFNYTNISHVTTDFYTVSLVVVSDQGCKDSIAKTNLIEVYPVPYARYSAHPQVTSIYDPVIHFTNESIGSTIREWDFGDGTPVSSTLHPVHTYLDTGRYTSALFIENNYGCTDSAFKAIIIEPEVAIYIPNAFSPNDDGKNDLFFPKGVGVVEFELFIFDRWGEFIYEEKGKEPKWDGRYKGNDVQMDVYIYKVIAKDVFNKSHEFNGTVTLAK